MQTFGYLTSMLPIVEEMYDSKEEQKKLCKPIRPSLIPNHNWDHWVVGITAGLEEACQWRCSRWRTINGMRAGLMGPIAGISDLGCWYLDSSSL